MCNQNDGHTFHIIQGTHCSDYFFPPIRIQHRSRLIQNNTFWMHGNHTGDRNPLFLSTGKLVRRMLAILIHSNCFQTLFDPFPDFPGRYSHVFRTKSHIFFHYLSNDLVIRVLKNHAGFLPDIPQLAIICCVFSIDPDSTLCWIQYRIKMFCQSRFTGTVMTQYSDKIPFLDIHGNVFYRGRDSFHISLFISSDIIKNNIFCFNNSHTQLLRIHSAHQANHQFLDTSFFIVLDITFNYKIGKM